MSKHAADNEIDELRQKIKEDKDEAGSWRKLAQKEAYEGIPFITLYDFAQKGIVPRKPEVRQKLGIGEIVTIRHYRNSKGRFAGKI